MRVSSPHVLLLLVVSLAACRSFVEPPPGFEGEFSAEAVLERILQPPAEGASEPLALADIKDFRASLEITRHDVAPPARRSVIVLWMAPGLWSVEQAQGGAGAVKHVFDGRRFAAIERGKERAPEVLQADLGIDRLFERLFFARFFREGSGAPAVIADAVECADGGWSLVLAKEDGAGRTLELAVDAATLKPLAMREPVDLPDGGAAYLETYLEELTRDESGNLIPRRMQSSVDGRLVQEVRVTNLSWNRGLREIDFAIPR
ncbi:MAG: hypothetical protein HY812_20100 [Planctomycetes bacterium]|nr:hypothetical protein [Planctomycetota bacterium]